MSFVSCSSLQKQTLIPEREIDTLEMLNIFPNSKPEDFAPCSTDFNEKSVFEDTLSCFNKTVEKTDRLNENIFDNKPKCILVKSTSKDVKQHKHFRAIEKTIMKMIVEDGQLGIEIQTLSILGLYSLLTNNIYLADNVDNKEIYAHELLHWFLDSAKLENSNLHEHKVWKDCSRPNYEPSTYSKIVNWFRRAGNLFN